MKENQIYTADSFKTKICNPLSGKVWIVMFSKSLYTMR